MTVHVNFVRTKDAQKQLAPTSLCESVVIRSDEGLTLETSALYSLRWPIYIFNLVDITKLPCYPHRRSTTVSLETFTLYPYVKGRQIMKAF